jgi:hypothetical protein
MKKSIGVIGTFLLGMVLCSCAPKEQTPQKQYPDTFPTFNVTWLSSSPDTLLPCEEYVLDHFISGNSYICYITVKQSSKSFAYQEDFSFKCNKDVFNIKPYWEVKENQLKYAFTFLVEVKSFSEDNKITVCYLDKETNVVDIPIVERNEKLTFHSFDYESEIQKTDETESLVNKVTLITSKAQYDSYPSLVSSQFKNNINDSFFNTRNLVYIVLFGHSSEYKYDKYFIENGCLFFRITKYHSAKEEYVPAVYDSTCVAYAIIVDKTDGDAFNNKMGIWANIRFSL